MNKANNTPTSNNLSRNNHYVPKVYLKHWANNKELYVYNLVVNNRSVPMWRKCNIKTTGTWENLYVNVFNEEESDFIEHNLDEKVERPSNTPLAKVAKGDKIDSNDFEILIYFIFIQLIRTPHFFNLMYGYVNQMISDDTLGNMFENTVKEYEIKQKNKNWIYKRKPNKTSARILMPISVELEDGENGKLVKIEMYNGKGDWLTFLDHALQDPDSLRMYKLFKRMKWFVLEMDESVTLPTSDNPVVVAKYRDGKFSVEINQGFVGNDSLIIVPVSPSRVIFGSYEKSFPKKDRKLSIESSKLIKEMIIKNAYLFIYSNHEDSTVHDIRKRVINVKKYDEISNVCDVQHELYIEKEGRLLNSNLIDVDH